METAIAKMASMPAALVGLQTRGVLKEGASADVLVFDLAKFTDNADYANPLPHASGIKDIIINGNIVNNKNDRYGTFV
jgi:N-acyl-D-amino-acid deacylase